jgi:YfiH family protein
MKIKYHFFGKNCVIDRALKNRTNLAKSMLEQGFSNQKVLFVNQIHGFEVALIDKAQKIYGEQNLPKADALVSNLPNIVLGVVTADCAPILLLDEQEKIIAAVHAGWRGAKLGVVESTILQMKNLGAKNISAIIGPTIQQNSYEVSTDFFDEFLSESANNKKFFASGSNSNKYLFDLPFYVEEKLLKAGVKKIQNQKVDTYKNEEIFYSFRRSTHQKQQDCGRNISIIAIE